LKEIASEINLNFSEKKIEVKIDKKGLKQTHIGIKTIDKACRVSTALLICDNSIIIKIFLPLNIFYDFSIL
ncbi:MAG: hypothetical protein PHG06_12345, partial [Parabacteroides sp.]|nr:hypothetical protein [Parabacteroides sp.]